MIEIIRDKATWNHYVDMCKDADVYHTYDYHKVTCGEDDSPVLVVYKEAESVILLPLLLRNIEGTSYRDVTSVYGYCGPLTNRNKSDFNTIAFQNELRELLLQTNIVSVFSRLHPFIDYQTDLLNAMGEIVSPGDIVNINLLLDEEIQQQHYNKRLKTYINKCRRNYEIIEARSEEDLQTFIEMYYLTMKRVSADERYFFPTEYFNQLMASKDFNTELLLALDNKNNQIAAGALFFKMNQTINYHLSGVKDEYLKLNPIKLLLDEERSIGAKQGYRYFNLGGGVGNKEDSLFRFKSGYSNDYKSFKLWRFIVNPEAYQDLVNKKFEDNIPKTNFFPLYRTDKMEIDQRP